MNKYETIKKIFENHSNPKPAISMSKYMKDQFSFYGIAASDRRNLYKDFLKLRKSKVQSIGNLLNNVMRLIIASFNI